ncbi:hypothetical protein Hanom_Chr10g00897421 [Helianthus anomalus]
MIYFQILWRLEPTSEEMGIDMIRGCLTMCYYQLGFIFLSRLDTFRFQKKMQTGDSDWSTGLKHGPNHLPTNIHGLSLESLSDTVLTFCRGFQVLAVAPLIYFKLNFF